jgi:hypothetical protein
MALFLSWNVAYAKSSLTLDSIKIGSSFMAVDGDDGRFREDNYITDEYSGGLEELLMSGKINEALLDIDAWALYDGDYGLNLKLSKEDAYYLKVNNRQTRRYYDGSNEPWNPASYGLATEFADREDGHIYADRFNADVEFGLKLDNLPDLTFGYTHWARDGQETLLRGEDISKTGLDTLRAYPALASVDGASEKVFVQLSDQIAEKHNVSLKQELEIYHDDQFIDTERYANGALSQVRSYYDEPQFQESLTHVNYNSFLTEKTYLSTNYLFQDLKNRTNRTELRPISGGVATSGNTLNQFTNPDTNNEQKANILNMGLVNLDGLVKDLRIGFNTRFQKSDTDNEGEGLKSGTLRKAESAQSEYQYAESFSVVYSGIKKTNLSYTLELEQRKLNWSELADIGSYEMVTDYAVTGTETTIDRETNIRNNDIINTLLLSTRLNDKSKVTAKYKHADKRRKYENVRDNLPASYPGYLGSSEQTIDQVTLGYNASITQQWNGGLQYIFEDNELGYARQGGQDGMQMTRNAISGNLMGLLTDKFTLTFMMMGELQDLETPGEGISTNPTFYQGEKGFDYKVNRYVGLLGGSYRLSDKTSTNFGIQHTEVDGTIRNSLDTLWVSANHNYNDDTSLTARLEVFNFNEKTVGYGAYNDYDDYHGVGVELVYGKKF